MFVNLLRIGGYSGEEALAHLRGGGGGSVIYDGKKIGSWSRCNRNYPLGVSTDGSGAGRNKSVSGLKPDQAVEWLLNQKYATKVPGNVFPSKTYVLRVAEMTVDKDSVVTARIYYNVDTTYGSSAASTPAKSSMGTINLKTGRISVAHRSQALPIENEAEIVAAIKATANTAKAVAKVVAGPPPDPVE